MSPYCSKLLKTYCMSPYCSKLLKTYCMSPYCSKLLKTYCMSPYCSKSLKVSFRFISQRVILKVRSRISGYRYETRIILLYSDILGGGRVNIQGSLLQSQCLICPLGYFLTSLGRAMSICPHLLRHCFWIELTLTVTSLYLIWSIFS